MNLEAPKWRLPFSVTGVMHWPLSFTIVDKMHDLARLYPPQDILINKEECKEKLYQTIHFPRELIHLIVEFCPCPPSSFVINQACDTHIQEQLHELNEFMVSYRMTVVSSNRDMFKEQLMQFTKQIPNIHLLLSCLSLMRESRMFQYDYREHSSGECYVQPLRECQVAKQLWYLFSVWFDVFINITSGMASKPICAKNADNISLVH